MPELSLLVGAVVFVIAALVIFHVVKSVIKAVMLLLAMSAIVLAVLAGMVVVDVMQMKERLSAGERLLLVAENGSIAAGYTFNQPRHVLSPEEVATYKERIRTDKFNGSELLFVIEREAFDPLAKGTQGLLSDERAMMDALRKGKLKVYPEPLTFKVVRFLPVATAKNVTATTVQFIADAFEREEEDA